MRYFKILNSRGFCNNDAVGTFTLKPMNSIIGYKHIRWIMTENVGCSPGGFALAGLDVYGILSTIQNVYNIKNLKIFFENNILKNVISAVLGNSVAQC